MQKKLSERQFDIMTILWNSDKPMLASEILNSNPELNINTVQSVLKSLVSKNYIEIAGIIYSGTVLARTYQPLIHKEEYLQNLYSELENPNSHSILVSLIQKETDIDKLNELEQIINSAKERLKK